ncbi:MAG: Hpt domain-containing protein, partial [Desulfovibrionales bacterium]
MNAEQSGRNAFLEEAGELLVELEAALLELEQSPKDGEIIGRVFRALHTVKGSGAMFGFDEVAAFTHDVETAFDMVREGKVAVTKELLDLTLKAGDHIQLLLDDPDGVQEEAGEAILQGIRNFLPQSTTMSAGEESSGETSDQSGTRHIFRIRFVPDADIFCNGTNPLALVEELVELGDASVVTSLDKVPPIHEIDPEKCYASFDIILDTHADENAIRDVFIFVEDSCELTVRLIDEGRDATNETYKRL